MVSVFPLMSQLLICQVPEKSLNLFGVQFSHLCTHIRGIDMVIQFYDIIG